MSELSRRELLAAGAAMGFPLFRSGGNEGLIHADDLAFLRSLARDTIILATRSDGAVALGVAPITPGGDYPALWVRDLSMAAGCGLIPASVLERHLQVIARSQNGFEERQVDRAVIPPFSVPDHINFQGGSVFFPGTYSSGLDQGGEPYGVVPPYDDDYEFVHLAYLLWKRTASTEVLRRDASGQAIWHRLQLAMMRPPVNSSGLVETDVAHRGVGFGFCDGVYLTGSLLFASLLRFRALGELAEMALSMNEFGLASDCERQRHLIIQSLYATFAREGWLRAATEVGSQPDVWGTIYALYLGAVEGESAKVLAQTLARAIRKGTICYKGAVRHVPTDKDFSSTSAWEKTAGIPKNRYQNGAYWHVPTGWLASVLWKVDREAARSLVKDMIAHFREEDFRLGGGNGAPWECLHPDGNYRQNRVYMASVSLPLEALSDATP